MEAALFFGSQAAEKVGRLTVRKLYQREYHFFDGDKGEGSKRSTSELAPARRAPAGGRVRCCGAMAAGPQCMQRAGVQQSLPAIACLPACRCGRLAAACAGVGGGPGSRGENDAQEPRGQSQT